MTDKESKLIERLMQGDMEAYDELMPNARPEDRMKMECFIKMATQDNGKHQWLAIVWYLFGWNVATMPNFESITEEIKKKLASRGIDAELLEPKQEDEDA